MIFIHKLQNMDVGEWEGTSIILPFLSLQLHLYTFLMFTGMEDMPMSSISQKWRICPDPPFHRKGGYVHILHFTYVQILHFTEMEDMPRSSISLRWGVCPDPPFHRKVPLP